MNGKKDGCKETMQIKKYGSRANGQMKTSSRLNVVMLLHDYKRLLLSSSPQLGGARGSSSKQVFPARKLNLFAILPEYRKFFRRPPHE